MKKLPELAHVKYVKSKGKVYAYFNTGRKKPNGKPLYSALPAPWATGFYDSYAACMAGRNRQAQEAYTVERLCDEYQDSKEFATKLAASTQKAYKIYLRQIVELLGEFPADGLERSDVTYVLDREEMGAGKQNLFVAVLGAAYRWARQRNKTDQNPTRDIPKAETGEHIAWPQEVLDAALGAKNDRLRLSVALLFYTGQRIGDVCAMRWSNVKDGTIKVVQEKTGKPLTIPLHSELRAELDRYGKRGLSLLTKAHGKPVGDEAIRDAIKAFVSKQGHPELRPHGLRKNAVIALLSAGCSVAETAAITGQTYQLVEYYARQIDQERMAGAAILKMEQSGDRKTAGKTGSESGGKP